MISCIIIEDQPPAQRILKKYIGDVNQLDLKGTFGDALAALEFLKNNPVDLLFLDIHLPKLSGIDFLKMLSPKPNVILTTAFPDYALQGYELDVVDYLLKPFSFERFFKAVSKVIYEKEKLISPINPSTNETSTKTPEFIFIKAGTDFQKIEIAAIQFIKSIGDYTQVFTKSGKHLVSHPLKYWLERLPTKHFCQIHKSCLINVRHIDKVSGNVVYLGMEQLPIGRTFKERFFKNYLADFSG